MGTEGGAAPGTVGGNLIALINQPSIPHPLYCPPAGLNVIIVHGDIGMLQVNPESDALGHCLPLLEVAKDTLPTAGVKLVNAIFFNLCLAGKAKFLLHLQLYGQPMGIPASDARGKIALHRLIAWYDILKDTSQHMMYPWAAVSRRWSLIQYKATTTLASFYAPLEDFFASPQAKYTLLKLWKIHLTAHWMKHKNLSLYIKVPPSRDGIYYTRGTTLLPPPEAGALLQGTPSCPRQ